MNCFFSYFLSSFFFFSKWIEQDRALSFLWMKSKLQLNKCINVIQDIITVFWIRAFCFHNNDAVLCSSKNVFRMKACVSLPRTVMNLVGLKELLWGKGGCFTLIMGDIVWKIFVMSMTESFSEFLGGRVNQALSFVLIHALYDHNFKGLLTSKITERLLAF